MINKKGKTINIGRNKIISTSIKQYIKDNYNYSFDQVRDDYKIRILMNINYFLNLSKELTENPPRYINKQNKLF